MATTHGMILAGKGLLGAPDDQIAGLKLQFAHQLYDKCLERYGESHEQTLLVLDYMSALLAKPKHNDQVLFLTVPVSGSATLQRD